MTHTHLILLWIQNQRKYSTRTINKNSKSSDNIKQTKNNNLIIKLSIKKHTKQNKTININRMQVSFPFALISYILILYYIIFLLSLLLCFQLFHSFVDQLQLLQESSLSIATRYLLFCHCLYYFH